MTASPTLSLYGTAISIAFFLPRFLRSGLNHPVASISHERAEPQLAEGFVADLARAVLQQVVALHVMILSASIIKI